MTTARHGATVVVLLIAAAAVGTLAFVIIDGESAWFAAFARHHHALAAWTHEHPALAAGAFIAGYAAVTAFSLPIAPALTVIGGFLFGLAAGTLYAVIAATIGATVAFLLVRWGLAEPLRKRCGPAADRFRDRFRRHTISYLLFLRLAPIVPFWLVNVLPAVLGVPLAAFVVTTAIGIVPGTFAYASLGRGIGDILDQGATPDLGAVVSPPILLPLLGLAALSLVPVAIPRLRRAVPSPE